MVEAILRNEAFRPSQVKLGGWIFRQRLFYQWFGARRRPPAHRVLKPCSSGPRWTLFFLYSPDGTLKESQRVTLCRLKNLNRSLFVVCATSDASKMPGEVFEMADALYWKALSGFDFSAYAIGLNAIADAAPHADVFVLNDTVYGPFGSLDSLLNNAQWELTGFTGCAIFENHIQSYAFLLRDVTKARMHDLRGIFPLSYAYDDRDAVILCFETQFARVASRTMTVGSFWSGTQSDIDPSLTDALTLVEEGFPFVKKSLLGKHRNKNDVCKVNAVLANLGLPDAARV
jgi:hypothetical protein